MNKPQTSKASKSDQAGNLTKLVF